MGRIKERISKLETIEQKSFWIITPVAIAMGVLSLTTIPYVYASALTFYSGALCVVFPIVLALYCSKTKNYHVSYPLLCLFIGSICIPLVFILNGGFYSGMPIFCVLGTAMCTFCYDKKFRWSTFTVSIIANCIAFAYVNMYGTANPLIGDKAVEFDIIISYIIGSVGLYIVVNFVIDEIRNYVVSDDAMKQYIDSGVRNQIIKAASEGSLNQIGIKKKMVIAFLDISQFTSITEDLSSEDVTEFLNVFLSIVERTVHMNGGIIDKYIGDCAMAYWEDEDGKHDSVYKAIKAVFEVRKEIYGQSQQIFERFKTELNFQTGIDYGDVIFGNIGSQNRKDYTVIGDAVNTASRIESLATSGEILISENAAEFVKNSCKLEALEEETYLKGKGRTIKLYRVEELLEEEKKKDKTIANKKEARENYHFYVCGCRGSFPVSGIRFSEFGGDTSCYVLKKGNYAVIIDCGTGLQNAESILSDCKNIDILLTHVHYDHILGFLNPIFPKNAKIRVFGHFSGWVGANTLKYFVEEPYCPFELVDMETIDVTIGKEEFLSDLIRATFYRADHPSGGCIIKLIAGENKICIFADCEDFSYIDPAIAKDADLLLYDGTFDKEDKENHKRMGHSTWQDGVEYAKKEKVKRLVITHHCHKTGDHTLLLREKSARAMLPNASFARQGDCYKL